MARTRTAVAIAALCAVLATAGCGLGPGESSEGTATLTITRDYGSVPLGDATVTDPPASETVLRLLDREAEITTRYGGGFVQSIDGIEGSGEGGRVRDWFFFVNGIESSTGSAEVEVRPGDRIWWDYRDWTDALRTPAVVGSWPEPLAQGAAGDERLAVEVVCFMPVPPCDQAAQRLEDSDVDADVVTPDQSAGREALRLLVGPWHLVEQDTAAGQINDGPAVSGVFARFGPDGDSLVALNERAGDAVDLGPDAGLVAAVRRGDDPPTIVATGSGAAAVDAAIGALDAEVLRDHYAVGVAGGDVTPLPVTDGE